MRRLLGVLAGLALLTGCVSASGVMKGFVGQPIQKAMVKYGPPTNAFDMPDGTRAFQWVMTDTYNAPAYATNTGSVQGYGNAAYWQQNTTIVGGGPVTSKCPYTLYANWSDAGNAWMISSYEKPSFMCE